MVTSETAKPKRKLSLSRHTLKRLDPESFRSITAVANSNNKTNNTCTSAPFGMFPELPLARRP